MSDAKDMPKTGKAPWSRNRAIVVMAAGGIAFGLAIVIPAETGTILYNSKIIAGALGLCVLCYGAYKRPMKTAAAEMKKE